jgi:hypothetical protein
MRDAPKPVDIEFSVLCGQSLAERRILDERTLAQQIRGWERKRNERQARVRWRFTTKDARERLERLYPLRY